MRGEIDLRVLKVIHLLVTTGSAKETARFLDVSQSSISYMLNKARDSMGTPLFVRTRDGLRPCATAVELSQKYLQYINQGELSLKKDSPVLCRSVHINTNTLTEMVLAATHSEKTKQSSGFYGVFHVCENDPEERVKKIKTNIIDIDIGSKLAECEHITAVKLFTSKISVLKRKESDSDALVFHKDLWSRYRHVASTFPMEYYNNSIEGAGITQQFLESRDIAVISGSLINMVSLCANSHYVMLIPSIYSAMLEKIFPVQCLSLPPEIDICYDCYLHYSPQLKSEVKKINYISEMVSDITQYATG
ncbi:TPA: LysR family transcriptional regulator [Klebsiella aerogenes]|nr:LysR family transcriptional regulator [Klebsiella aerogenes]HEJ0416738.1 LysR family transcriptional regulator [Klebsiella aerogenes]HEM8665043.1 LysR family transcriptional regulator [Klebsiella aerogenes]